MRKFASALALSLVATGAFAQVSQVLTTPPSGDNQKSQVIQWIGPVKVAIAYSSPDVHAPNGDDRRGKIFGTDVAHYGLRDLGFGTCKECPWRAGSNENTTFSVSDDVMVEGQKLPAGTYGLFMIGDPAEWTVVFSKNSTSWGSFFYDAKDDALRVKVKPSKSEYNEWLTYEFTDRHPDRATVAMKWEDLQVPINITVPNMVDLYIARMKNDLRSSAGFQWTNWNAAAQYALRNKRFDEALEWAQAGARPNYFGSEENFTTLSTLADAQEAKGMTAEAATTRQKALGHPTANATAIHMYARAAMTRGNKAEAIRAWQLNAKRYPNQWPVNVGLMRAASAQGNYKEALKYAKLAQAQAPDDGNKRNLENLIKQLEQGKDIN